MAPPTADGGGQGRQRGGMAWGHGAFGKGGNEQGPVVITRGSGAGIWWASSGFPLVPFQGSHRGAGGAQSQVDSLPVDDASSSWEVPRHAVVHVRAVPAVWLVYPTQDMRAVLKGPFHSSAHLPPAEVSTLVC